MWLGDTRASALLLPVAVWMVCQLPRTCRGSDSAYENITALVDTFWGKSSGYNPDVRPKKQQADVFYVSVSFALVSIVEVDDVKQQFTVNGFMILMWQDERVGWNPEDFGHIEYLSPQPKTIWRPRLVLFNTLADRDMFKDDNSPTFVYAGGNTLWIPGGLFKASCALNMINYPFDVQDCSMQFCPMMYFEDQLRLIAREPDFDLKFFVPSEDWDLLESLVNVTSLVVDSSTDVFSCVKLHFKIKRRSSFYVLNILLPVVLLSFLNNFVFLIPEDSGEKLGYGITVLLSLSVFLTTVSTMIPRASKHVPAVTIFLFVHLLSSVVSILASMATVRLNNADKEEETHLKAEANYRHAAKKMLGLSKFMAKVDSERGQDNHGGDRSEAVRHPTMDSIAVTDRSDSDGPPPPRNKYRLISKHINKVFFLGSMLLWMVINLVFFLVTAA